ncbi:MAG: hypothetical protein K6G87_17835 [Butyrivibrio sp.]|nr:hypothetical protein [Butyrivibrio sp.]
MTICADYQKTLELPRQMAEELAFCTKGYSLCFQALGYHCWDALCKEGELNNEVMKDVYNELDITLSELAYEKIWDELSKKDKEVLKAICTIQNDSDSNLVKVEDIRSLIGISSNTFTTYRTRLIDSGILDGKQFGSVSFKLPRFDTFVRLRSNYL